MATAVAVGGGTSLSAPPTLLGNHQDFFELGRQLLGTTLFALVLLLYSPLLWRLYRHRQYTKIRDTLSPALSLFIVFWWIFAILGFLDGFADCILWRPTQSITWIGNCWIQSFERALSFAIPVLSLSVNVDRILILTLPIRTLHDTRFRVGLIVSIILVVSTGFLLCFVGAAITKIHKAMGLKTSEEMRNYTLTELTCKTAAGMAFLFSVFGLYLVLRRKRHGKKTTYWKNKTSEFLVKTTISAEVVLDLLPTFYRFTSYMLPVIAIPMNDWVVLLNSLNGAVCAWLYSRKLDSLFFFSSKNRLRIAVISRTCKILPEPCGAPGNSAAFSDQQRDSGSR